MICRIEVLPLSSVDPLVRVEFLRLSAPGDNRWKGEKGATRLLAPIDTLLCMPLSAALQWRRPGRLEPREGPTRGLGRGRRRARRGQRARQANSVDHSVRALAQGSHRPIRVPGFLCADVILRGVPGEERTPCYVNSAYRQEPNKPPRWLFGWEHSGLTGSYRENRGPRVIVTPPANRPSRDRNAWDHDDGVD
jgi:hypothetical protein